MMILNILFKNNHLLNRAFIYLNVISKNTFYYEYLDS